MAKVEIWSDERMSNSAYHKFGKPTWWAYIKVNGETKFLNITEVRGDQKLKVDVEVPSDFVGVIYYGVGPKDRGVRDQLTVEE